MFERNTDEELMIAYQEGASDAFEELFKRYSGKIYGFVFHQLKNRAAADDIFQGTFLKLHQSRRLYDPKFPFPPWLFTICKSVLVDFARKKKRSLEDLNEVALSNAVAPVVCEGKTVINLDPLPEIQRAAIEFRYHEDLSFEEIALRLSTSPSNVRQLVSRGLKKLKATTRGKRNES